MMHLVSKFVPDCVARPRSKTPISPFIDNTFSTLAAFAAFGGGLSLILKDRESEYESAEGERTTSHITGFHPSDDEYRGKNPGMKRGTTLLLGSLAALAIIYALDRRG